jgi:hypothetical protein
MITNDTPKSKLFLTPLLKMREVTKILSLSRISVQALIDSGDLTASELTPSARRKKKRVHLRITSESLAAFYKKRFGHELDLALRNSLQN